MATKLQKKGFALGINLIETFTHFAKKIIKEDFLPKNLKTENEESSLLCARLALLHNRLQTRYLGYKDGFLFLPEMSFWNQEWRQKFYQAWMQRERLKYHHLITNVFNKSR